MALLTFHFTENEEAIRNELSSSPTPSAFLLSQIKRHLFSLLSLHLSPLSSSQVVQISTWDSSASFFLGGCGSSVISPFLLVLVLDRYTGSSHTHLKSEIPNYHPLILWYLPPHCLLSFIEKLEVFTSLLPLFVIFKDPSIL